MHAEQLAIGVFDSGMGGLTVLRALQAQLPLESFVYLGDTARLPYGTKSPETVKQYALQMATLLVERQIKALVIACNTATTAALGHLQQILSIPVIGVVTPGAQAVVEATRNQRVFVMATETTIASEAYQSLIVQHLPKAQVQSRACSVLVALAEAGMIDNQVAREACLHYLEGFKEEDTVLLGCTHFPVFKPLLQELLPETVALVDAGKATAKALEAVLLQRQLANKKTALPPSVRYLVTDSVARFRSVGAVFLGKSLVEAEVELVDINVGRAS